MQPSQQILISEPLLQRHQGLIAIDAWLLNAFGNTGSMQKDRIICDGDMIQNPRLTAHNDPLANVAGASYAALGYDDRIFAYPAVVPNVNMGIEYATRLYYSLPEGGSVNGIQGADHYPVTDHHPACLGNAMISALTILGKPKALRSNYAPWLENGLPAHLATIAYENMRMHNGIIAYLDSLLYDRRCANIDTLSNRYAATYHRKGSYGSAIRYSHTLVYLRRRMNTGPTLVKHIAVHIAPLDESMCQIDICADQHRELAIELRLTRHLFIYNSAPRRLLF